MFSSQNKSQDYSFVFLLKGITEIGVNAFRNCRYLKKISLPSSLGRIKSYAFFGCRSLETIEHTRSDFKYIYDLECFQENDRIIFGLDAFYQVPWARKKWGDYYISQDTLHIYFGDDRNPVIPEGVKILGKYSLSYRCFDLITLPTSLTSIQNFAFLETEVFGAIALPDGIKTIDSYAFASLKAKKILFPASFQLIKTEWKETEAKIVKKVVYPKYKDRYVLSLKKDSRFKNLKCLKVIQQNATVHENGQITEVRKNNDIYVGASLLRRLRMGRTLICITRDPLHGEITSVTSFVFQKDKNNILISVCDQESLQGKEKVKTFGLNTFRYSFNCLKGDLLKEKGQLRILNKEELEEWFVGYPL